jgi:putative ABC transport system permease protein
VTRLLDAGDLPGDRSFDLLAVDPSTFASAAYWSDGFAPFPLEQVLERLAGPGEGPIPVVAVRGDVVADTSSIGLQGHQVPIHVVGRASAFPGMTSLRPLLVVDQATLLRVFAGAANPLDTTNASTEFWVRGDPTTASGLLETLRYPPYLILTASQVMDIPTFIAVIDTFLVLGALGLAAALLVFAGTLLYLQARQRSQVVSYGLSLRMGMKHEGHRRALVLELGAMLGSSYVVGIALAVAAVLFVIPDMDPLSTIPPVPLLRLPIRVIGVALAGTAAAAWVGGWWTNRIARRFDLGQVMRLAD